MSLVTHSPVNCFMEMTLRMFLDFRESTVRVLKRQKEQQ